MMGAVARARHTVLAPYLKPDHKAIGSINSPMQCMMKEICAQCLQLHKDPKTGEETVVSPALIRTNPWIMWIGAISARVFPKTAFKRNSPSSGSTAVCGNSAHGRSRSPSRTRSTNLVQNLECDHHKDRTVFVHAGDLAQYGFLAFHEVAGGIEPGISV